MNSIEKFPNPSKPLSTSLALPAASHALSASEPDVLTLGKTLAASGYFKDASDAAKAVVKILYGREVGVGPATSMSAIHIVEGKPTYSATLMGALIKRSGKYDYRVLTLTDDACELAFFQRDAGKWVEIGRSSFSLEDAKSANLAGKQVWKNYARNMLFARALSNGARWHTPDVFGGTPVYTPEELGAAVDGETGEYISTASTPASKPEPRITHQREIEPEQPDLEHENSTQTEAPAAEVPEEIERDTARVRQQPTAQRAPDPHTLYTGIVKQAMAEGYDPRRDGEIKSFTVDAPPDMIRPEYRRLDRWLKMRRREPGIHILPTTSQPEVAS